MPTYQKTVFEPGQIESTGILVVNLGTPSAPTTAAVRQFLKEFLSDPRVVEYPRLLWWLILNLVILRIRPSRSAEAYQKVWTEQGSPLMVYSKAIVDKLRNVDALQTNGPVYVELAMTYGEPSIDHAIDKLLAKGVRRILTLPLYPQYSGTTTAAIYDAVVKKIGKLRWLPETRFISCYHDAPGYITALADNIREYWANHGRGEKLMMSFHGIPESLVTKGDPYQCHCHETARLLVEELGLSDDEWLLTFQSRVGREQWLQPYTDETVRSLAKQGVRDLDVVCPGFSADCLETIEEIAMQNAEFFIEAGGQSLRYIPALNANEAHVQFLAELAGKHIVGWNEASTTAHSQLQENATATGTVS
jgi:ferrochelatase